MLRDIKEDVFGEYGEGYEYYRQEHKYVRDWATLEEMKIAARWRKWFAAVLSVVAVIVISISAHFSAVLGIILTVLCGLSWAVFGSERFKNWFVQRQRRNEARNGRI